MDFRKSDPSIEKQLHRLASAVLQLENALARHCRREAERLGRTAPADALLAIAAHAQGTHGALLSVWERDGLTADVRESGAHLLLAELRGKFADLLGQGEDAYRATLLGLRHGVDLVRIMAMRAGTLRKRAVAEFCAAWLANRTILLERAEAELVWFALNAPKGADQRWLGERYGRVERGPALHPLTKETGHKGASNVGQDETSGSE